MSNIEDELKAEIKQIDSDLQEVDEKLRLLEYEKEHLLKKKRQCTNRLKDLMPTSSGGTKSDLPAEWNQTNFEWSQKVNDCLKNVFKLEAFRPLQLETINVTLSRLDCLVIMPTGGGKSMTYFISALVDTGLTLVVSPLVSLIEDQLWILRSLRIQAESLNSNTSKEDLKRIQNEITNQNSNMKLLYVTPEKLAKSKAFMNKLEKSYELKIFKRIVIDEVHCCSAYGHDFRPDYKFLGIMKRQFPNCSLLGLTATATQSVIDDIKKILNLQKFILFKSSFNRPNIFYEVKQKSSNHEECMNDIAKLIKTRFLNQSGIVYCFSQKESEQVAQELASRGIRTGSYHANMNSNERTKTHERWLRNQVNVIVATIAFGMGIDKSDCRFVIHHSLSKSLENFYQESGRAGRDGLPAYSILFFRFADVFRQASMVFTEQTGLVNLYSMVNYCTDIISCKRSLIADHFQEIKWHTNGSCNKMCDICKDEKNIIKINCVREANFIISVLDKHTAKSKDNRITANKLAELAVNEINKSKDLINLNQFEIERLTLKLLTEQYLREDFHFTPYNTICYLVKANSLTHRNSFELDIIKRNINNVNNSNNKDSNKLTAKNNKKQKEIDITLSDDEIIQLDFNSGDEGPKQKKTKI